MFYANYNKRCVYTSYEFAFQNYTFSVTAFYLVLKGCGFYRRMVLPPCDILIYCETELPPCGQMDNYLNFDHQSATFLHYEGSVWALHNEWWSDKTKNTEQVLKRCHFLSDKSRKTKVALFVFSIFGFWVLLVIRYFLIYLHGMVSQ